MTPTDIEARLRSYLDTLTSMTPLARPDLPRDSHATADQSEVSSAKTAENGPMPMPAGADHKRSWRAAPLAPPHRRGRLVFGTAATVIIVVGLALAVAYGPRSSNVGGPGAKKTPTLSLPISGAESADQVVPIDTTTDRPGLPIPLGLNPSTIWASPDGPMLYVSGHNGSGWVVVPVDSRTNKVLPAIPVGMEPSSFAESPNGKVLFVLDGGFETAGAQGGDITPIDTATDQPGRPILPDTAPTSMVITPNGRTLYVTDDGAVYPIHVATDQAGPPIEIAGEPIAIVVAPDGKTVYLQSFSGTVTPIDTATNLPGRPITVGSGTPTGSGIVITPNGRTVYALDCDAAVEPQREFGCLVPIDTTTDIAGPAIAVSPFSVDLVLAPNGRTLYLAPARATGDDVTAINTDTNTGEKVIKVAAGPVPGAMVVTPNSRTLYVAGEIPGTVTPIAVATNTVGAVIPAGSDPVALVITPNGKTLYALDVDYKATVG